jgi:hypothetical protein
MMDGSFHEWLEERGLCACLMHMVRQIRKVAGTEPAIERSARVGLKGGSSCPRKSMLIANAGWQFLVSSRLSLSPKQIR